MLTEIKSFYNNKFYNSLSCFSHVNVGWNLRATKLIKRRKWRCHIFDANMYLCDARGWRKRGPFRTTLPFRDAPRTQTETTRPTIHPRPYKCVLHWNFACLRFVFRNEGCCLFLPPVLAVRQCLVSDDTNCTDMQMTVKLLQ